MQLKFNQRKQLIEALEARREWAQQHDAAEARKHRADEDAELKKFRDKCRDLAKLNLVRLKDEVESMGWRDFKPDLPSCPMSAVTQLDQMLASLAITRQESFTIDGGTIHWLLTHDDNPAPATVCK